MSIRRLPVYILADCSGSMTGDPIESVKVGIRTLHANLMSDPNALETAYLSIITFGELAQQAVPLTEIVSFSPPDLRASGPTSLGAALRLLVECVEREVRKTTAEQKGDWRPMIFLMTDGQPTDDWQAAADELRRKRLGNIIAVACGEGADVPTLKRVTETVLAMREMTPDAFAQFFKWVSASISGTSAKVGSLPHAESGSGPGVNLPPPPPVITIIP